MDDVSVLNMEDDCMHLPPGFRFYPTDEELITHYLLQKITLKNFSARAIGDVDLNKCEPWDLPSKAKMGEKEWYFFCQKDRKYANGNRTNRATEAGYWKATGKDKEIYRGRDVLVGMKKTLVFYTGRAPKGQKTSWVIHEYRLEGMPFCSIPKSVKDEWVVCRVFDKNMRKNTSPTPAGSEGVHSPGEDLFDSTTLPPLMDPPSSCFKYNKDESFDFKEVPSSFSTMMAMENQQAINHQASSNPPQNQVFYPQVLPQSYYCSFAGSANLGYLDQQDAMLRAKSDASSAIRRHCKVERCSNQSMDCPSQDTGLITDRNIEISSLMSKHYGDLDNPSSSGPVMDLDSIWKY